MIRSLVNLYTTAAILKAMQTIKSFDSAPGHLCL